MSACSSLDSFEEYRRNKSDDLYNQAEANAEQYEKELVNEGFIASSGYTTRELFLALDGTEAANEMIREVKSGNRNGPGLKLFLDSIIDEIEEAAKQAAFEQAEREDQNNGTTKRKHFY